MMDVILKSWILRLEGKTVRLSILSVLFVWVSITTHSIVCPAEANDARIGLKAYSSSAFSIHDENDMKPVFSPDGKKLAYIRSSAEKTELWILDLETQQERLVGTPLQDAQSYEEENKFGLELSWAPDSRFFVFVGAGMDLYLGCVDMDRSLRLTKHSEVDAGPKWSPDEAENNIVFVSGRTGRGDIYLIRMKEILDRFFGESADSSFRNKSLADEVEGSSGRNLINLTEGSDDIDYGPNWSKDGKSIVYHSYSPSFVPGQESGKGTETFNVWITKIDNPAGRRCITNWRGLDEMHPSLSPDGNLVAFYSGLDLYDSNLRDQFTIYVLDSRAETSFDDATENDLLLLDNPGSRRCQRVNEDVISGTAWFPNSKGILYVRSDVSRKDPIWWVTLDQSGKPLENKELTTQTEINSDIAFCNDGAKIAFIAQEGARNYLHIAVVDLCR